MSANAYVNMLDAVIRVHALVLRGLKENSSDHPEEYREFARVHQELVWHLEDVQAGRTEAMMATLSEQTKLVAREMAAAYRNSQ